MNNPDKTQQPEPEQLLKLLELQMSVARERRLAREAGRSKAGIVGIVIIVVGAAIALFILMMMLEQMRPEPMENGINVTTEAK